MVTMSPREAMLLGGNIMTGLLGLSVKKDNVNENRQIIAFVYG